MFEGPYTRKQLEAVAAVFGVDLSTLMELRIYSGKLDIKHSVIERSTTGEIVNYSEITRTFPLMESSDYTEVVEPRVVDGKVMDPSDPLPPIAG